MTTLTDKELIKEIKERIGSLDVRDNIERRAYEIALASLEAEPVAKIIAHYPLGIDVGKQKFVQAIGELPDFGGHLFAAPPVPVVPEEKPMPNPLSMYAVDAVAAIAEVRGWNACRAAMLQSGNFRENKNSSTNNFREIAETSTNYPVIPSEVLSAILKVAKIRADFDDFDGDRRGIGDCLDEAEQELIVTINKYASQLAAEPIAPNDVREQTAIPQVPVTPDGWISCSERMPNDGQHVIILCDGAFVLYAQYRDGEFFDVVRNGEEFFETQSRNVTDWMPLPEPPQEVNRG
ncbi:putative phage protein [Escherichia coli]|nr:putative phage protein [Escherichia coli]GCS17859.1 putative phage protein [Escherichia coli]